MIYLIEAFDPDRFIERFRGVVELIKRGATEGEKGAARAAFDRMMTVAKTEIGNMRREGVNTRKIQNFELALRGMMDAVSAANRADTEAKAKAEADAAKAKAGPKAGTKTKTEPPKEEPKARSTGGKFDIIAYAHYYDPASNNDKVYGIVSKNGEIFCFWGRRMGSVKAKAYGSLNDAFVQFKSKTKKGYQFQKPDSDILNWLNMALSREI